MDRGALIRTFKAADLGFILHSRHQFHWHTGYVPPQPMAVPHIGAVIAKVMGPKNPTVPAFVAIGQNMEIGGESPAVKAFHTAGFPGDRVQSVYDCGSGGCSVRQCGLRRIWAKRVSRAGERLYEQLLADEPVYQFGGDFNASR